MHIRKSGQRRLPVRYFHPLEAMGADYKAIPKRSGIIGMSGQWQFTTASTTASTTTSTTTSIAASLSLLLSLLPLLNDHRRSVISNRDLYVLTLVCLKLYICLGYMFLLEAT